MRALQGCLIFSILLLGIGQVRAFQLAPNAPKDRPYYSNEAKKEKLYRIFQPCVAQARESYPAAKQRFLNGSLQGSLFSVTTRLHDSLGHEEQVFIIVRSIKDGQISGTIASAIELVKGYKDGDDYNMPESEILDWTISKPDGTEEGNCMGKLMDSMQEQQAVGASGRS